MTQVKKDPKLVLSHIGFIYQVGCCLMAIFWTALFCSQYSENGDTILITMKTFNVGKDDRYPTFSVCFEGAEFHWYNDVDIFNSYGIDAAQFELMLKGKTPYRYERLHSSQLFIKSPTFLSNRSFHNLDRLHLKSDNFLKEFQLSYEKSEDNFHYSNGRNSNTTPEPHFHFSYQSPDIICFTRNDNDPLNTFRHHDLITLDSSVIDSRFQKRFQNTTIKIFVHYPGQLMRSFDKAKYTASFKYLYSSLKRSGPPPPTPGILEFIISQSKTLRKRHDSNIPCNPNIQNYDEHLQLQLIKQLGCVPIYWKNLLSEKVSYEDCIDPEKLKVAYRNISDFENIRKWNEQPCDEMSLLTIHSVNKNPITRPNDIAIAFYYTEKMYEEIQYSREMGFENWLSNVGGFVGIFLGYSMMQFPELIIWIFDLLHQRKYKTWRGKQIV